LSTEVLLKDGGRYHDCRLTVGKIELGQAFAIRDHVALHHVILVVIRASQGWALTILAARVS
jgi:hypothetical protein